MQRKQVVLASKSPRRIQLLKELGLEFQIIPADVDEKSVKAKTPVKLVKKLSELKAQTVKENCACQKACIISADTIVVFKGRIFGKPIDENNAFEMLKFLNGRTHKVLTGVTVINACKHITFAVTSKVKFKRMTDAEIKSYISVCKPLDKAGAYGIQDKQIVESYNGSYTNIVGLPIEKLSKVLLKEGVINVGN